MSGVRRFVFVCSGNICRSPMAEVIARRRLAEARIPAIVLSMGTLGIFGRPAHPLAVEVCARAGLDLSSHSSQGISRGILAQADAVLVMAQAHREALGAHHLDLSKVRLLSRYEAGARTVDIEDPLEGTAADFEACFERIDRAVAGIIRHLRLGLGLW